MTDNPRDPELDKAIDEALAEAEVAAAEAEAADSEASPDASEDVKADAEPDEAEDSTTAESVDGVEVEPDHDGDGEVSDTEAELAERTEDLLRITAEYTNYRRRTERERTVAIEMAKAQVVTALLPLLDDLDLAAQHGALDEAGPLKSLNDKFRATLTSMKVAEFGAEGDDFDPERHEAVQDLSEGDDKAIGTVLRRGYVMGDRLLRTAMVIIADRKQ
ncbi:nucleotide exchange factor GrpE [Corynebacterium freiburgense]|uniref:nucleotide exchange factor GrpE n=1 Tax=Corynebacterium freiburgense TaxID=556548 RepID=UPI0003FBE741|nr:heat shock protein GrpE [Corynebacterium freiburgense]